MSAMAPSHPYRLALEQQDAGKLAASLHPDVVFETPVFDAPIEGRDRVLELFGVLATVFEQPQIIDELVGDRTRAIVFTVMVDSHQIEGVDHLKLDEKGLVRKITVSMRPLLSVVALALRMARTDAPSFLSDS
jgi:SnoaL-like protein